MYKLFNFSIIVLLSICFNMSYAQELPDASDFESAKELISKVNQNLEKGYTYKHLKSYEGRNKIKHETYQLYFEGILIENNVLFTQTIGDKLSDYQIAGTTEPKIETNRARLLSEKEAIELGKEKAEVKTWAWEDKEFVEFMNVSKAKNAFEPETNLVYSSKSQFNLEEEGFALNYKIKMHSIDPLGDWVMHIDALSGEILAMNNHIHHVNASTFYDGTQDVDLNQNGTTFETTDPTRNNLSTLQLPLAYTNINQAQVLGTTNPAGTSNALEQTTLGVQWATQEFYDYLLNEHGIISLNDDAINPYEIRSLTNHDMLENAGMVVMPNLQNSYVFYGAGNPTSNQMQTAVASLDVVAHELAHGLTAWFGGGLTYQGESGAINESISDIMAVGLEEYLISQGRTLSANSEMWELGELLNSTNNPLRSFIDPNAYGLPDTYLDPCTWASTSGLDHGGVHTNSSVINHWFYLINEGGSGTNSNNTNYNVIPSLNIQESINIILDCYNRIPSNSTFLQFAQATLDARQDMNIVEGLAPCTHMESLVEAWRAVGINPVALNQNCILTVEFDDPETQVCVNQGQVYSAISNSTGLSYQWFLNGALQSTSPTPSITLTTEEPHELSLIVTDGQGNTDAASTIVFGCECVIHDPRKQVLVDGGFEMLDFSSGLPELTTPTNFPGIYMDEGSISHCDQNGELIFYIGFRRECPTCNANMGLFDKDHNLVLQLSPEVRGSSSQIGMTIPCPDLSCYNIFLAGGHGTEPNGNRLQRLIIIMDPSDYTQVQSAQLIEVVDPNDPSINFISKASKAILPGCNPDLFHVVFETSNNMDWMLDFDYTNFGSGNFGEITSINNVNNGINQFRSTNVSYDGTIIISNGNVSQFDRSTSNVTFLADPVVPPGLNLPQNARFGDGAFSPNQAFYYSGVYDHINRDMYVFQIDLINNNVILIDKILGYQETTFILGPDNKIYYSGFSDGNCSIINYPNESAAAGIEALGINRNYLNGIQALPHFMEAEIADPLVMDFTFNIINCMEVEFFGAECFTNYNWDFGDGNTSNDQNPTHTYTSSGIKNVTLSSQTSGGIVSMTYQVNIQQGPPAQIAGDAIVCNTTANYSSVNVADTYTWTISPTATLTINNPGEVLVTFPAPGLYELYLVTVDQFGCESQTGFPIEVCEVLLANGECKAQDCSLNNGASTVNPTGGIPPYTYNWYPPLNNPTTQTVSNLGTGVYYCTVTDAIGNTDIYTCVITDPFCVEAQTTDEQCGQNNGSATAVTSGGIPPFTFLWSNGATTQTINNLAAGNYSCTVTDLVGSQATTTAVINTSQFVDFTFNQTGCLQVTFIGVSCVQDFNWDFSSGPVISMPWNNTYVHTFPSAGIYPVTLTSNTPQGPISVTQQVEVFEEPQAQITGPSTVCNLTQTYSAAPGNYLYYDWSITGNATIQSPNSATTDITFGAGISFTLYLTTEDIHGCKTHDKIEIKPCTPLQINGSFTPTSCGLDNGSATTNVTGGQAPYTYQWNTGATTPSIQNLGSGSYTCVVTDSNGNTDSYSFVILQAQVLTGQIILPADVIHGDYCFKDRQQVIAQVYGGQAPYTYNWVGSGTLILDAVDVQDPFLVFSTPTYQLYDMLCEVTDANGCSILLKSSLLIKCPYSYNYPNEYEVDCDKVKYSSYVNADFALANNSPGNLELKNTSYFYSTNYPITGTTWSLGNFLKYELEYVWEFRNNSTGYIMTYVGENFMTNYIPDGKYDICLKVYFKVPGQTEWCIKKTCQSLEIQGNNLSNINTNGSRQNTRDIVIDREVESSSAEIELFPNPVSDQLNIKVKDEDHLQIMIFDMSGKKVSEHNLSSIHNNNAINVGELLPGIYLAVIKGQYKKWSRRFIKI